MATCQRMEVTTQAREAVHEWITNTRRGIGDTDYERGDDTLYTIIKDKIIVEEVLRKYLLSLPSRRLPVECDFSPDGLLEARFRVGNTPNLREGEQLPEEIKSGLTLEADSHRSRHAAGPRGHDGVSRAYTRAARPRTYESRFLIIFYWVSLCLSRRSDGNHNHRPGMEVWRRRQH